MRLKNGVDISCFFLNIMLLKGQVRTKTVCIYIFAWHKFYNFWCSLMVFRWSESPSKKINDQVRKISSKFCKIKMYCTWILLDLYVNLKETLKTRTQQNKCKVIAVTKNKITNLLANHTKFGLFLGLLPYCLIQFKGFEKFLQIITT